MSAKAVAKKRESSSRLFDQWVRNKNFHLSDFLSVCVPEFCLSINHHPQNDAFHFQDIFV